MPAAEVETRMLPLPLFHEAGHERVQAVQQSKDVEVHRRSPCLEVRIEQVVGAGRSGVAEDDVHAPETLERTIGETLDFFRVRHVHGNAGHISILHRQLVHGALQALGSSRCEHYLHTAIDERRRGCSTNTGRASRDHRRLA